MSPVKLEKLLTVGYEGVSVEDFLSALTGNGVTTLLDIREIAASRRRGFAKSALRANLTCMDIAYQHEPKLGSPREVRHRLRETGDYNAFFLDFDRYLATQRNLLERLAISLTGSVVLLCYERHYQECHRKSVAALLGQMAHLEPQHVEVRQS